MNFIKRNASTILTCVGGVGVVVTAVLAAKASPKASKRLERAEKKKGESLSKTEKFKIATPAYIPTIVAGAGTIACIFGANILNKRTQAALVSAYALIDTSYKEYKNKLKELYGEEAHEKIVNAIAIEKAEDVYIHSECLCNGCDLTTDESCGDEILFYDEFTGRYFESTIERVLQAIYHFNRNFTLRGYAVLNELFEFLGLSTTDYGSVVGWSVNDDEIYWVDFNFRKVTMDDGLECYIIETPWEPTAEYIDYY